MPLKIKAYSWGLLVEGQEITIVHLPSILGFNFQRTSLSLLPFQCTRFPAIPTLHFLPPPLIFNPHLTPFPLPPRRLAVNFPPIQIYSLSLSLNMSAMNLANGNGHPTTNIPTPFKIFVGYDPREDIAYEVCRYSLLKRSTIPIEVIPIIQSELRERNLFWRARGKLESTEFSFTRFLTPHLANYTGWAVFVDCDFLYLADIKELTDLIDDKYAVMCVQHDYTPKETTKMDGAVQTLYPRKNWSSMVLYNCGHPKNKVLNPETVNTQSGAFLHRFQWLEDHEIGSIPFVWNFLVGHNKVVENDSTTVPKAIHYTLGGPWFEVWKDCEFGDLWLKETAEYQNSKKLISESESDSAQEMTNVN